MAPSANELSAALRGFAESALREGQTNGWAPSTSAVAFTAWQQVRSHALARTVVEGDAMAGLLVRSSLEHMLAVADAISQGRAFVPHSTARTAVEHALRATHLVHDQASDLQRAARRLNDWFHAVDESEKLRTGVVDAGHPGADQLPDPELQRGRIRTRAAEIGLEVSPNGKRVQFEQRPSTMGLAELYLSGEGGAGMPSLLMRRKAAMHHGTETGLLESVRDAQGPHGVNVMEPWPMPGPELANSLMAVPLAVGTGYKLLRYRYTWADDAKSGRLVAKKHDVMVNTWMRGVTAYLDDVAPDRPRTGLVTERDFGNAPSVGSSEESPTPPRG